jgi:hypothetical protein
MQTRTPRAFAAAAALALFAGACTDAPTASPAARAPDGRASLTSSSGPALISNTVRYRDRGGRPASGRSGSATVEALALLAKDGTASLDFGSRHVAYGGRGGDITRVQVKALAPDGEHKWTRNLAQSDYGAPDTGTGQLHLRGVGPGDQLQLQAHVKGLDPHRTDVVTVVERVKRLPDLRVQISAPAVVKTYTPVTILALVSEHNGDMGANTVCELYIDGQWADHAYGVWVDAGDAVTCAMSWSPATPASRSVEVRVRNLEIGEWEPADNVGTATVEVVAGNPTFRAYALFRQVISVDSALFHQRWSNSRTGLAGEERSDFYSRVVDQWGRLDGWMPGEISSEVGVRVSMSTDGRVLHSAEWPEAGSYGPWGWCTSRWDGPAVFTLCARGGATTFEYNVTGGAVTYHSLEYSRIWDQLTGEDQYFYHWTSGYAWDERMEIGSDMTFDVRLDTGEDEHVVTRTLQLVPTEPWVYLDPYRCGTWDDPETGYTDTLCSLYHSRQEYIYGF